MSSRRIPCPARLAIGAVAATLLSGTAWLSETAWLSGTVWAASSDGGQPTSVNPRDGLDYVWIPPGTFTMGCVDGDELCYDREKPAHKVTLTKGYWLGKTEVTVAAYRRFTTETAYRTLAEVGGYGRDWFHDRGDWGYVDGLYWGRPLRSVDKAQDDWPALQLTWFDAKAYCDWAGGRLPTDAEWERAVRGGVDHQIYYWGNQGPPEVDGVKYENGPDIRTKKAYPSWDAWENYDDGYTRIAPVAQFAPNAYGLYDMIGNAKEWIADWWSSDNEQDNFFSGEDRVDPKGPQIGGWGLRVARGGGWVYAPDERRSSYRSRMPHATPFATFGVRCALDDIPG